MSWTIQHVAPQPREGGSRSASIREIRSKASGRLYPCPTYSRLFPPTVAKKSENTITDSYSQPIRINELSRPIPSQSDLLGASGSYWDQKKVKTMFFVTPVSRPASSDSKDLLPASLRLRAFALKFAVALASTCTNLQEKKLRAEALEKRLEKITVARTS
jgi:hypothetical protein